MGDAGVTILCTGDIHIGRHPGRIPTGKPELSVPHVWNAIVDLAVERSVDVVALTGDIVDRENRFFEAIGPLERGICRLADHEISTFAVAGNHDFDVFLRVANAMDTDRFHLLGAGGQWERMRFESNGSAIDFVGWSFPTQHVENSPLSSLSEQVELGGDPEVAAVGLLHADLDQPRSKYAPVDSLRLARAPVDAWLLGHIHSPELRQTDTGGIILYPGSPQPLDPGEPGVHGPWIVDIGAGGGVEARQQPLATVRYEPLDVDLEGVDSEVEFERAVPEQIRENLEEIAATGGPVRRVVYRLRYQGRTALHRRLEQLSRPLVADLDISFDGIGSDVDRVEVQTRPKLDLEALATGEDPPAVLAELLLKVRDGRIEESERGKRLLRDLRERVDAVLRAGAYGPLRSDEATKDGPDEEWIREQVMVQGMSLLDEMLAAKRGGETGR